MGDNHGDEETLQKVVDETEGEEYDFIIHVGDITNSCKDGMDEGTRQLKSLLPLFEQLSERGELLYIWGNRDFESCAGLGLTDRIDEYINFDFEPGTRIPTDGRIEVAGQEFTQDPDEVNQDTILVTHDFLSELVDNFTGKAYFSGHIHNGRFKNNILNTAFLYRGDTHGAKELEGGYFIVEIQKEEMEVSLRSFGGLSKGKCRNHASRGIQFVPRNWQNECSFCYEEDKFYYEIFKSSEYALNKDGKDITPENLVKTAVDMYIEEETPSDFDIKLAELVEEYVNGELVTHI